MRCRSLLFKPRDRRENICVLPLLYISLRSLCGVYCSVVSVWQLIVHDSQIGEEGLSAGKEIEVSVDMVVPQQPGRYVSHWRLAIPGSLQFGQRVWAMLQVRRVKLHEIWHAIFILIFNFFFFWLFLQNEERKLICWIEVMKKKDFDQCFCAKINYICQYLFSLVVFML